MTPLRWVAVLALLQLAIVAASCIAASCWALSGCGGPHRTVDEGDAIALTVREWRAIGRELGDCDPDELGVQYPDYLLYTQLCKAEPYGDDRGLWRDANGCLSALPTDDAIVVDPRAPEPLRVVVHETAHWLMECAYGDVDAAHRDPRVWEGLPKNPDTVEGRAKAGL